MGEMKLGSVFSIVIFGFTIFGLLSCGGDPSRISWAFSGLFTGGAKEARLC
jgi:hypothetical protein